MRALSLPLFGVALALGCTDECKSLAPVFQLDIRADPGGTSLVVVVAMDGERRVHVFNLSGDLDDGETSVMVELGPGLAVDFDVDVIATAYSAPDGVGRVIGAAQKSFSGTPDGCNRFFLDLRRRQGMAPDAGLAPDGGLAPDAGMAPDGGVPRDGGTPDGGVPDVEACNPTCATAECTSLCALECAACSMSCAGSTNRCTAVCQGSSSCTIECAGVRECQAECSGTSDCEVDCSGAQDCKSRCVGQAACRLNCLDANQCMFTACEGGQMTCGDGSIVCNRACP